MITTSVQQTATTTVNVSGFRLVCLLYSGYCRLSPLPAWCVNRTSACTVVFGQKCRLLWHCDTRRYCSAVRQTVRRTNRGSCRRRWEYCDTPCLTIDLLSYIITAYFFSARINYYYYYYYRRPHHMWSLVLAHRVTLTIYALGYAYIAL